MKPATIIGFLLILLGIIGFATGGISFTHQKKDVDLGSRTDLPRNQGHPAYLSHPQHHCPARAASA